jgi:signal transduction histidine kinase/ActR/RegA family two-component response regulator
VIRTEDPRLDGVLEMLLALARLDFAHRIDVGESGDTLDAIAVGMNMLGEELEETAASRRELEAAYRLLQETQAQLIHAGKLAAIGQLAGGVAHEINNPASYVTMGHAVFGRQIVKLRSLLGQRGFQAEQKEELLRAVSSMESALADATEGMQRIRAVVRDLRTFSRMDDEAMEGVMLNDVVLAACNLARHEIRYRAELVTTLGELPPVRGNRGRLGQVLMNLLVNAAQAIPESSEHAQQIRVLTRREGERAVLVVEDSGPGVPEHLRQRIFEPFFTTKPPEVGTGLGLSLVAEIVRRHDGTIHVGQGRYGGACFEISLPLFEAGRALSTAEAPQTGEVVAVPPARILLIDDDRILLRSVKVLLEPEHEVVTALGGTEALTILERDQDFDLVLCDLLMPRVDGVAVFSALKRAAPQLADRVVFCSGGAVTRRSKEFLALVRNRVLEKPLAHDVLLDAIAQSRTSPRRGDPGGASKGPLQVQPTPSR